MCGKFEDWIVEEWNLDRRDIERILVVSSRRRVAGEMFDVWTGTNPERWIIMRRGERVIRERRPQPA